MKTVILLRHAKSDWNDTVTRDFDRPLNDRGRVAAHLMGTWAKDHALAFDAIVASPAVRVRETLDLFLEGYGTPVDIRWERRVYLASSANLLDVLHDVPEDLSSILLVGHNPGLEDLILDTVPEAGGGQHREAVEAKYPTAATATLHFPADTWADVASPARIAAFVRPRDLDASLGPDSRDY